MNELQRAHMDAEAVRLRATGMGYREIAAAQGCSASTAHDRVNRALAAVPVEAVDVLRTIELARLDALTAVAWDQMTANHPKIDHGRIVRDEDGEPMIDHGVKLSALDRLLRIAERRSRLLGLDQPTKIAQEVTTYAAGSEIDYEVQRMALMLASDPGAFASQVQADLEELTGDGAHADDSGGDGQRE